MLMADRYLRRVLMAQGQPHQNRSVTYGKAWTSVPRITAQPGEFFPLLTFGESCSLTKRVDLVEWYGSNRIKSLSWDRYFRKYSTLGTGCSKLVPLMLSLPEITGVVLRDFVFTAEADCAAAAWFSNLPCTETLLVNSFYSDSTLEDPYSAMYLFGAKEKVANLQAPKSDPSDLMHSETHKVLMSRWMERRGRPSDDMYVVSDGTPLGKFPEGGRLSWIWNLMVLGTRICKREKICWVIKTQTVCPEAYDSEIAMISKFAECTTEFRSYNSKSSNSEVYIVAWLGTLSTPADFVDPSDMVGRTIWTRQFPSCFDVSPVESAARDHNIKYDGDDTPASNILEMCYSRSTFWKRLIKYTPLQLVDPQAWKDSERLLSLLYGEISDKALAICSGGALGPDFFQLDILGMINALADLIDGCETQLIVMECLKKVSRVRSIGRIYRWMAIGQRPVPLRNDLITQLCSMRLIHAVLTEYVSQAIIPSSFEHWRDVASQSVLAFEEVNDVLISERFYNLSAPSCFQVLRKALPELWQLWLSDLVSQSWDQRVLNDLYSMSKHHGPYGSPDLGYIGSNSPSLDIEDTPGHIGLV